MRAGTASIHTVEGSGALPAGAYRPTRSIGRMSCSQRTPGAVSSATGCGDCARWNASTRAIARCIASRTSASTAASAASNSAPVASIGSGAQPS